MSDKITDEKLAEELRTEFARAGGVNAIGGHAVWIAVARRAKELLGDKPPINVLVKDDGTWLEFHGDGKTSLIRLETLAEGPISRTALKAWCRDYRAGATATPILDVEADKPVATREEVEAWLDDDRRRETVNKSRLIDVILAVLSHFAPPRQHASDCAVHRAPAYPPGPCDCGADTPRQRMMADGMDAAQIEAAMADGYHPGIAFSVSENNVITHCARVAHRLANTPEPEVDVDGPAANLKWQHYCLTLRLESDESILTVWAATPEKEKAFWRQRAVAAMEKGDE